MSQTSFAERLERIEASQDRPMKDRILAGISEEQRRMETATPQKAAKKPARRRRNIRIMPFIVGFALMYAGMMVSTNMTAIDAWLATSDQFAPVAKPVMIGIGISVIFLMLFFAFKLQRAAFRVLSEPGRLVFATGMVLGLSVGMGPTDFTDVMMARLDIAAH